MRNLRCRYVVGDTLVPARLRVYRLANTHSLHSVSGLIEYCVSSIDTNELQRTDKYDSYIGIRNVILGVFCNAIINLKTNNGWPRLAKSTRFPGRLPVFHHFYPSTRLKKNLPVLEIGI